MKLRIIPLISPLHGTDTGTRLGTALSARLAAAGFDHTLVAADGLTAGALAADVDAREDGPLALALLTGGTEAAALETIARLLPPPAPLLLLTHEAHNGLPAALEVLAWLRAHGRRGRIVLVPEGRAPDGLAAMLAALGAHQQLRRRSLAVIGGPSSWLVASAPTAEDVHRTWGIRVTQLPIDGLLDAYAAADGAKAAELATDFLARSAGSEVSPAVVTRAARLAVGLADLVAAGGHGAVALRCFDLLGALHTSGCLALSHLLDTGVTAGCEGDVPATLTMHWLAELTGESPFMANPQDLDCKHGRLGIAHCTIARRPLRRYRLRSHFESGLGVAIAGELPPGPITLARIGGPGLRELFVAEGELVSMGISEDRCRTQLELQLEPCAVGELLHRPLGNHVVLIPGHYAAHLHLAHELHVAE